MGKTTHSRRRAKRGGGYFSWIVPYLSGKSGHIDFSWFVGIVLICFADPGDPFDRWELLKPPKDTNKHNDA